MRGINIFSVKRLHFLCNLIPRWGIKPWGVWNSKILGCPGIWKTKGPKRRGEKFQWLCIFDGRSYLARLPISRASFVSTGFFNHHLLLVDEESPLGAHYGNVEWYPSLHSDPWWFKWLGICVFFLLLLTIQLPPFLSKSYQLPLFDGLQRSPQVIVYLACLSLVKMWVKDLELTESSWSVKLCCIQQTQLLWTSSSVYLQITPWLTVLSQCNCRSVVKS